MSGFIILCCLIMFAAQSAVVQVITSSGAKASSSRVTTTTATVSSQPHGAKIIRGLSMDPDSVICDLQYQQCLANVCPSKVPFESGTSPPEHRFRWAWRLFDMAIGGVAIHLLAWMLERKAPNAHVATECSPEVKDAGAQCGCSLLDTPEKWASSSSIMASGLAMEVRPSIDTEFLTQITAAEHETSPSSPTPLARNRISRASEAASAEWAKLLASLSRHPLPSKCRPAALEAAQQIITCHVDILCDMSNPLPVSQLQLKRVPADTPEHVLYADQALREVARRLLGPAARDMAPIELQSPLQAQIWCSVASFLTGRVQSRREEYPGREPDLNHTAAAAFKAVLQSLWWQGYKWREHVLLRPLR
jgi:hypothetical protein